MLTNTLSVKTIVRSVIIYRIRNNQDIKSKKLIYFSLIHAYLTYCINVWSSSYQTNLKSLSNAR